MKARERDARVWNWLASQLETSADSLADQLGINDLPGRELVEWDRAVGRVLDECRRRGRVTS